MKLDEIVTLDPRDVDGGEQISGIRLRELGIDALAKVRALIFEACAQEHKVRDEAASLLASLAERQVETQRTLEATHAKILELRGQRGKALVDGKSPASLHEELTKLERRTKEMEDLSSALQIRAKAQQVTVIEAEAALRSATSARARSIVDAFKRESIAYWNKANVAATVLDVAKRIADGESWGEQSMRLRAGSLREKLGNEY